MTVDPRVCVQVSVAAIRIQPTPVLAVTLVVLVVLIVLVLRLGVKIVVVERSPTRRLRAPQSCETQTPALRVGPTVVLVVEEGTARASVAMVSSRPTTSSGCPRGTTAIRVREKRVTPRHQLCGVAGQGADIGEAVVGGGAEGCREGVLISATQAPATLRARTRVSPTCNPACA